MRRMVGHVSHSGEEPAAKRAQHSSRAALPDLNQLNPAEREALQLLGEGHTAKSIASFTRRSVAAINERLREARRKTGASSSRELARLLRAQKTWDEEMGMASTTPDNASTQIGALPRAGSAGTKGTIVMGIFVIAAIAVATFGLQEISQTLNDPARGAVSMERQGSPSGVQDSLLGDMFSSRNLELRQLFERVRAETRDAPWAARAEAAIKARYAPSSSSGQVENVRVICASTVCEMAGLIGGGGENDVDVAMQTLQDHRFEARLDEIGLKRQGARFVSRPNSDETAFAIYWSR